MTETFSAQRAAHYAGFETRAMLDYLEREEVFEREEVRLWKKKRQHGRRRKYTFRDIVVLRSIADLLEKGVSVHRIKVAILAFSRDERFKCERDSLLHGRSAIQYFVTDGENLFFTRGEQLLDVIKNGQGAFSFVVDLALAEGKVRSALKDENRSARRA